MVKLEVFVRSTVSAHSSEMLDHFSANATIASPLVSPHILIVAHPALPLSYVGVILLRSLLVAAAATAPGRLAEPSVFEEPLLSYCKSEFVLA